jgi:hypothetical protein
MSAANDVISIRGAIMPVLKTGIKAYYDTFSGLIPCKVLRVYRTGNEYNAVDIKLTAGRGAYKRGEVLQALSTQHVCPRNAVYVRNGQYRIRAYGTEVQP